MPGILQKIFPILADPASGRRSNGSRDPAGRSSDPDMRQLKHSPNSRESHLEVTRDSDAVFSTTVGSNAAKKAHYVDDTPMQAIRVERTIEIV